MDTIPGVLDRLVARFGDREGLVDGERRLTFAQLVQEIDRVAAAFVGAGVEHGDRVALWAPNSADWVIASLAVHRIGGVLVPLNTRFKGAEAHYVLETAEPTVLVTVTDFLGTDYVSLLLADGPVDCLRSIVTLPGSSSPKATAWTPLPDNEISA